VGESTEDQEHHSAEASRRYPDDQSAPARRRRLPFARGRRTNVKRTKSPSGDSAMRRPEYVSSERASRRDHKQREAQNAEPGFPMRFRSRAPVSPQGRSTSEKGSRRRRRISSYESMSGPYIPGNNDRANAKKKRGGDKKSRLEVGQSGPHLASSRASRAK